MKSMILMHGNIPCAFIDIEDQKPFSFLEIINKNELPVGVYSERSLVQGALTDAWYRSRAIPDGRPGIEKILNKMGYSLAEAFLMSSGISLTDTFWIKEEVSPLSWEDVNFYDNGFEPTLSNAYYTGNTTFSPSPDFTTTGILEKFWVPSTEGPCLIKMDKENHGIQVANEVVAYRIAEELGIPCVEYDHVKVGETHACMCRSFISNSKEDFVSLYQIESAFSKQQINATNLLPREELNKMKILDVLIGNEDRHGWNVGLINGTLCPAFDNGSCLNYRGKGNDVDLKLPRAKRSEVAATLDYEGMNELPDLTDLLEEVYEEFEIGEDQTKRAIESLQFGEEAVNKAIYDKQSDYEYES